MGNVGNLVNESTTKLEAAPPVTGEPKTIRQLCWLCEGTGLKEIRAYPTKIRYRLRCNICKGKGWTEEFPRSDIVEEVGA